MKKNSDGLGLLSRLQQILKIWKRNIPQTLLVMTIPNPPLSYHSWDWSITDIYTPTFASLHADV